MNLSGSGLLRRVLGRPGDRQRGFAEAGVAVTGAALVLGAALGSGVASTVVTMSDGVTWLPDGETGQVVQVNPGTGRAERRLQVAEPGSDLEISQRDGHLVITDRTSGTVSSIDLSSLLEGGARRTDEPARVLVAGGVVHLVTAASGVLRAVDPLTLRDLGEPFRSGAPLADAVVDDHGTVWLVTTAGDLRAVTWVPRENRFDAGPVRRVRGGGAGTRLLPHARGVTVFAPDGRSVLQVGVGRDLAVAVPDLSGEVLPAVTAPAELAPAGVPGRSAVMILARDRVLDVAVGALGCTRPGNPAVFAGLVYVPCTGAGRVVVLRADGTRARADVVLPAGRDPRLLVDDGRLVVHTEDGSRAVVVEADGRTRVIDTGRSRAPVHDPRDGRSASVAARPPTRTPMQVASGTPEGAVPGAPGGGPAGPGAVAPGHAGDEDGPHDGQADAPRVAPTGTARTPGTTRPGGTARPTPTPTLEAAPTDVEATARPADADGLTDVAVSWRAAATRPDAYVVRSSVVGVAPVEVDGRSTAATVRGIVCGQRATFTVEAVTGAARSAPASSPAVRTAPCPQAPDAPTGVAAVAGADGSVTVSWTASDDDVDSYTVGPDGGSATTVAGDAGSVVLRDVPPGTGVRFAVHAVRDGLRSRAATSAPVDVVGRPGPVDPLLVTLSQQSDAHLTIIARWTLPPDNGSPLTTYDMTWSGPGVVSGSETLRAMAGCSAARGCGPTGPWRTNHMTEVVCAGAGLCTDGGTLTVTVTPRNAVGAGPVAGGAVEVPHVPTKLAAVSSVEPVAPGLHDPGVSMVVHLQPPAAFREHAGTCLVDITHSNGDRSSAGWSCRPGEVVVGPFPAGQITVVASTVASGGGSSTSTIPYTAQVPARDTWAYCDPVTNACTEPRQVGLADAPVVVTPVPWTPRFPTGDERPPLAATGAGLLLAALALRVGRLRRTTTTPYATTEETPA